MMLAIQYILLNTNIWKPKPQTRILKYILVLNSHLLIILVLWIKTRRAVKTHISLTIHIDKATYIANINRLMAGHISTNFIPKKFEMLSNSIKSNLDILINSLLKGMLLQQDSTETAEEEKFFYTYTRISKLDYQ